MLQREQTSFASIRVGSSLAAGSFLALPLRLPSPPGVSSEREKVTQKRGHLPPDQESTRNTWEKAHKNAVYLPRKTERSRNWMNQGQDSPLWRAPSSSQTSNHRTGPPRHRKRETTPARTLLVCRCCPTRASHPLAACRHMLPVRCVLCGFRSRVHVHGHVTTDQRVHPLACVRNVAATARC